jgi:hypothetical protein
MAAVMNPATNVTVSTPRKYEKYLPFNPSAAVPHDKTWEISRDGSISFALGPRHRRLRVADWARKKYLFVRVGYLRSFGGSTRETGVVEAYSRFPLPLGLMAVSRLRTDLRDTTGGFSVRPRYRLHFEREVPMGRLTATPYVRAEVLYDSLPRTWNWRYQAGVEIALTRHWRVEPYYARHQNQHSADINRIGFIVKTFW